YFSDHVDAKNCNRCSNCTHEKEKVDLTEEAQKILSCVRRMNEQFGITLTAKVLRGSRDKKVRSFNFHELSTYGILSGYTEREIVEWINFLIAEGELGTTEGQFPTLKLNTNSVSVLKGSRKVYMYVSQIPTDESEDFHKGLFDELRHLRKVIADEKNVPPYIIFADSTLRDIARYLPETKEAMLHIKGIGVKKYEQFGQRFSQLVSNWKNKNPEAKARIPINNAPPR